MLNKNAKYINNRLALRPPQKESLERFQQVIDILSLSKYPDLDAELVKIREAFPTLTSFEREFPSICFALATGIGKTRLMGALIAYLHYEKDIKNFFVVAPNLTIYKKLKDDLSDPANSKYVFRGLDKFSNPPRIIDGDNYEEFRQQSIINPSIIINIFNISKLNSESGKMHRLNEVLGQSYFAYLQSLPDLCIFMDESHHYNADRGFKTLNELKPILGVELTATPQKQEGTSKINFKNVVYEYSLAHALNDELYVKIPTVFTRKDFRPEEYPFEEQLDHEKLNDGIRIHEETKSQLDVYARNTGNLLIKPFVLVVAKDTEHSRQIREYLISQDFLYGDYKDKVLEINSTLRGAEKDENIELLLSLEKPDNRIEIVIHVNMLKEGWDVTNLYTIIPLRTSASETLTLQTIGRGLRLPYGHRTGVDEVDRLSIVHHDRYEAIVKLANNPDSLVRRVNYIDPSASEKNEQRETIELPSSYDATTNSSTFIEELTTVFRQTAKTERLGSMNSEQTVQVAQFVARQTSKTISELGKHVKDINFSEDEETMKMLQDSIINETIHNFSSYDLKIEDLKPVTKSATKTCIQAHSDKVIPIPQGVVQPFVETKMGFNDFTLDTRNINWYPSNGALIGTELDQGGETFEINSELALFPKTDTVENEIVRHIIIQDNIDYTSCSELIYTLIADAKKHFVSYLNFEETEKVMRERQLSLAKIIYAQMNQHFYKEETRYGASGMRPFTRIENSFAGKFIFDDIYDLRTEMPASEVKTKIFNGFKKSCRTLEKFDSNTERIFAIVLETDIVVQKWLYPSPKQFNIYYGPGGVHKYEPDFIVETFDTIYMIEIKAAKEVNNSMVIEKVKAATEYCRAVSEWNAKNNGKPWEYKLISHDEVHLQSSFMYLVKNSVNYEQLEII